MAGKFQRMQDWKLQNGAGSLLPGESQGHLLCPLGGNQVSKDRITVRFYKLTRLCLSLELGNHSLGKTQWSAPMRTIEKGFFFPLYLKYSRLASNSVAKDSLDIPILLQLRSPGIVAWTIPPSSCRAGVWPQSLFCAKGSPLPTVLFPQLRGGFCNTSRSLKNAESGGLESWLSS